AKLVVSGNSRQQVLQRARRALAEFRIEGVASVLPFHRAVVDEPAFASEDGFAVHTRWIETEFSMPIDPAPRPAQPRDVAMHRMAIELDGKRVMLGLPANLLASVGSGTSAVETDTPSAEAASARTVTAPVAGNLLSWAVEEGAQVAVGDLIATMEAMKM